MARKVPTTTDMKYSHVITGIKIGRLRETRPQTGPHPDLADKRWADASNKTRT
jgi:hypothetical protein